MENKNIAQRDGYLTRQVAREDPCFPRNSQSSELASFGWLPSQTNGRAAKVGQAS